jgi:hypothetical protein
MEYSRFLDCLAADFTRLRAVAPIDLDAAVRASWVTGANIVVDGGQRYPSARRFD